MNPSGYVRDNGSTWEMFATGSACVGSWLEEAKTAHGYMLAQHAVDLAPYLAPTHGAPNQPLDHSAVHSHSAPEGMHEESGEHLWALRKPEPCWEDRHDRPVSEVD